MSPGPQKHPKPLSSNHSESKMTSIDVVVAVWGEWHRNAFLRLNLPSLMVEQNIPKFASMIDCKWKFYTTVGDREILSSDPLFQQFAEHVDVEWIEVAQSEHDSFSAIDVHGRVWIEGMRSARDAQKFVMFMPPDVIWSDGGFGHFADLIVHQGKRAIYINWHLRAISDSFIPAFHERFGTGETPIHASSRELVRMSLDHIHPLSSSYLRESEFFPRHTEMMFWPVPGQGLLMHVFALTPFVFDTSRFEYTDKKLVTEVLDPNELHYVVDSDDLFIVSLAEMGKDRDWYEVAKRFDFVSHGEWWSFYDSPGNNYLAPQPFRLKFSDTSEDAWRAAEMSSMAVIRRATAAREVFRVWRLAKERGCNLAAMILSHILRNDLSHKVIGQLEISTILLPTDEYLKDYFESWSHFFVQKENFAKLRRFIRAHIISGHCIDLGSSDAETAHSSAIETAASGDKVEIQQVSSATSITINGARIVSEPYEVGTNILFIVDRPLISSSQFHSDAVEKVGTSQ